MFNFEKSFVFIITAKCRMTQGIHRCPRISLSIFVIILKGVENLLKNLSRSAINSIVFFAARYRGPPNLSTSSTQDKAIARKSSDRKSSDQNLKIREIIMGILIGQKIWHSAHCAIVQIQVQKSLLGLHSKFRKNF